MVRQNAIQQAPPHHVIHPNNRNSREYSASTVARALKQKKLKKTARVNDRSAPKIVA